MNNAVLGEFIGTMIMILFGSGVGCSTSLKKAHIKESGSNWVIVAFGWGVAVMLGVYSSGYFGSPGHLNPAVTIGFAIGGLVETSVVIPYIIAQIAGAFLGAAISAINFWQHFKVTTPEEGNSVGIFATGPAIENKGFNFLNEVIATFAFVFTLLLLPADFAGGLKPLVLVFLLVGISFSFGSTTGYAINPARDLGPRLMYTLLPIPNKNTDYNWKYVWVPILGPIVGSTLAVVLFNIL